MGTHPIFESDFDCLTEEKNKMKTEWLAKFRELFDKKEDVEEEGMTCPECDKISPGLAWFESLGALDEHLLSHYRMRFYLDNYRHSKKTRHQPWHQDYEKLDKIHLEKYLDREHFADYLRQAAEDREEEDAARKDREKKRHRQKLMVDKENERRRAEMKMRIEENKDIFNEDTDSDTPVSIKQKEEKRKSVKKRRIVDIDSSPTITATVTPSRVQVTKPVKRAKHQSTPSTPPSPQRKRLKPLQLQQHTLSFSEFRATYTAPDKRLCPLCDCEFEPGKFGMHITNDITPCDCY